MLTIQTFFMKYVQSIKNIVHDFHLISVYATFSGLKPNLTKCEVVGIAAWLYGVKKEAKNFYKKMFLKCLQL